MTTKNMKIILSGGSGFIGKALQQKLASYGHEVVVLTRGTAGDGPVGDGPAGDTPSSFSAKRPVPQRTVPYRTVPRFIPWDGETLGPWVGELEGSAAIVNLAGESIISKRWTPSQKERIVQSRIRAAKVLVDAMNKVDNRPCVLVNASAVGYYGNVPEGEVTEEAAQGSDFLAQTCGRWEKEARHAEALSVRVVLARIGIVLAKGGGALAKMLPPFLFFMGGALGSGKQWFPWIHRDDVLEILYYAIQNPRVSGPVNVTAPNPVRMGEFCQTLGRVLGRPSWAPVPAFVLRMLLGEMAEMLLTGQRAVPRKIQTVGYHFQYPHLEEALSSLLKS